MPSLSGKLLAGSDVFHERHPMDPKQALCDELLWLLSKDSISPQGIVSRLRRLSIIADIPAGIVEDGKSMRMWCVIGNTKAWHVIRTAIDVEGWKKRAFVYDTDALKCAWHDLKHALAFCSGRGFPGPEHPGFVTVTQIMRSFRASDGSRLKDQAIMNRLRKNNIVGQGSPMAFPFAKVDLAMQSGKGKKLSFRPELFRQTD